ncbi:hypothetical protein GA0061098_102137 [Bradyrhizobium shewense]|uniref:Uncharacterized protein n=1 Tax=Bradyrhizobium shewense TaxID=1761772 RepID=A0A1C3XNM4_9BRAD|nr:hypothetical protein [Bradyrhizobium shewense]SCB53830.1 hypothetical protein GA0061098_102137 [Bradyrhizobium shewense]
MWLIDKFREKAKEKVAETGATVSNWLWGVILAALGAYALSIFQAYFHLDHTPTWPEVGGLLLDSAKSLPSFLWDWLISRPYDAIIKDHPAISIAVIVLTVTGLILASLLFRANRILNRQGEILSDAAANEALVTQAGIKGRFPHARQADDGAPWKSLCEDILRAENKFVYILGANGIDTFGKPGSPLHEALQNFRGHIRVILCKPGSKQMKGRAAAVGMISGEYEKAIKESVRRLKFLKKQAHSIEGRYYEGQPNWKLIVTNSTLWVQYYLPGGPHVDQTPAWLLNATDNTDGFYHLFHMEFNRIWERCVEAPINLNS